MTDALDAGLTLDGVWAWLPLLPLAVGLALVLYRRTRPPVPQRTTNLLWLLRSASLSILLVLLVEPLLTYVSRRAERPVVVILVDSSPSMSVQEGDSTRFQRLQGALAGDLGQHLPAAPALAFADTPEALDLDTLGRRLAAGSATDLSRALQAAARTVDRERRPEAIVLLGDGGHNLGDDPVAVAADLGIPVYALGLGSRRTPDDLQVVSVAVPEPAFAGRPVRVDARLRAWGYRDRDVELLVEEDGRVLARTQARLGGDGQLQELRFSVPPLEPGPHLLRVRVEALEGELSPHNNQALLSVRVREQRLRILLVGGGPGPDLAHLRRLLQADSTLAVEAAWRTTQGWAGDVDLPPATSWDRWDAVLLVDPGGSLPASALQSFVEAGRGLLLLAGARSGPQVLEAMAPVLPLAPPLPAVWQTGREPLATDPAAPAHPLGRALTAAAEGSDPWQRLPPLTGRYGPAQPAPGSTVLLRADAGEPVVIAGSHGQGRVVVALGSGFWRQGLFARAAGTGVDIVGGFWRQAVRWLALSSPTGRVRVSAERAVYRAGEPVALTAEVYDELHQPLAGARVVARTEGLGDVVMDPDGAGRYEAVLRGLPPGVHPIDVTAELGSTEIGEAQARVAVEAYTVESADLRADPELLAAVARASGGDYRPLSAWRELADRLRPPASLARRESRVGVDIRDWAWFAVLVGLLGAEWILRKRGGML